MAGRPRVVGVASARMTPMPKPSQADMPALTLLAVAAAVVGVAFIAFTDRPLAGIAFIVAGAAVAALPSLSRRRARIIADVASQGVPASARVVSVEEIRQRGNTPPRMKVGYEITPVGRPPYLLSTRHVVTPEMRELITPGRVLSVRVDPENPKNVVLTGGASPGAER